MSRYECIDRLQQWLDAYLNFEKTPKKNIFWLDTMQFLCSKFSHPEQVAPCFHVAGSKGKGSVSAFISSILEAAGYSCGLYSSPHILDFIERIGGAHEPFSESVYENAAHELITSIDALSPAELPAGRALTWFELVTLYAFLCFKHAGVDFCVYEVGLGGRLDSTNVVQPAAACITPIELEHTEFLGDTIEKIAAEKGGIIKEGCPVFIASQKPEARAVFERIAKEKHAPLVCIDRDFCTLTTQYTLGANGSLYMATAITAPVFSRTLHAQLQLPGEVQAQNAALAAVAVKSVLPQIPETAIEQGLSTARLPARFELYTPANTLTGKTTLILDGAHTVNSVRFTLETLKAYCALKNAGSSKPLEKPAPQTGCKPLHLLFACAADKDMVDIAKLFAACPERFSRITLTRPGAVKQSNLKTLCEAFDSASLSYTANEDYTAAITQALQVAEKEQALLLVTGSFYLIAEIKHILEELA